MCIPLPLTEHMPGWDTGKVMTECNIMQPFEPWMPRSF